MKIDQMFKTALLGLALAVSPLALGAPVTAQADVLRVATKGTPLSRIAASTFWARRPA